MTPLTTECTNSREPDAGDHPPCAGSNRNALVSFLRNADLYCFVKFCAVGASGVVIDLSTYLLLRMTQMPVPAATALAIWVAMTWNFRLNRRWTFADRNAGAIVPQYIRFCLSCLTGACINWSTRVALWSFVPWFASHELVAAGCGVAAGTFINFSMCRLMVFNRSHETSLTDRCTATGLRLHPASLSRRSSLPAGTAD